MSLSYSNHGLLTSMFLLCFFQWGLIGLICNYSVRLLMLLFENDNKIKQLKLLVLRVRGKWRQERKHTHYLTAFISNQSVEYLHVCSKPSPWTERAQVSVFNDLLTNSLFYLNCFASPSYTFLFFFYMGVTTKFS